MKIHAKHLLLYDFLSENVVKKKLYILQMLSLVAFFHQFYIEITNHLDFQKKKKIVKDFFNSSPN